MIQTVVAGSGAIQNTVWIPDVGVAVCSNRSKVTRHDAIIILIKPLLSFFFKYEVEMGGKKKFSINVISLTLNKRIYYRKLTFF